MTAQIESTARRPIVLRLSLGAALLLLALSLGIIFFSDYRYRVEMRQDAETQAKVVAASLVASVDFQDRQSASEYLVALRANPRIAAVLVRNQGGAQFVAYERPGVGAPTGTTSATAPSCAGSRKSVR